MFNLPVESSENVGPRRPRLKPWAHNIETSPHVRNSLRCLESGACNIKPSQTIRLATPGLQTRPYDIETSQDIRSTAPLGPGISRAQSYQTRCHQTYPTHGATPASEKVPHLRKILSRLLDSADFPGNPRIMNDQAISPRNSRHSSSETVAGGLFWKVPSWLGVKWAFWLWSGFRWAKIQIFGRLVS